MMNREEVLDGMIEDYHNKVEMKENFDKLAEVKIAELTFETDRLLEMMKSDKDKQSIMLDYLVANSGIVAIKDNKIVMLDMINKLATKINDF